MLTDGIYMTEILFKTAANANKELYNSILYQYIVVHIYCMVLQYAYNVMKNKISYSIVFCVPIIQQTTNPSCLYVNGENIQS